MTVHTADEIRAMFPPSTEETITATDYYLANAVSSYELLCAALEKGGYSVADKDVASLLAQAELLDDVPVWEGIASTQEGRDLDKFLDQFRADTDTGFRIVESKLKACLGGFAGRLGLHAAGIQSQPWNVSPDDAEKVMQNTSVRFVLKPEPGNEKA